jgi:hypothetical protein
VPRRRLKAVEGIDAQGGMMSQETMQALADRLTDDPQLRAEFQRDPEAAAKTAGIALDDSDRAALRSEDWGQASDQELSARVSKAASRGG